MSISQLLWKDYYTMNPDYEDGFCSRMSHCPPRIYKAAPCHMSRNSISMFCSYNGTWIFPPKSAILSAKYLHLEDNMVKNNLCVCGSGLKQKDCHASIHDGSALANLWQKYTLLNNEIQRQCIENKTRFICKRGCSNCCSDYFYVSLLEFIAIKHHLLTFDKTLFRVVCNNAREQYIKLCRDFPDEYKRLENLQSFNDLYNDHAVLDSFLPCPLLNNQGECAAYPARPLICRLHGISSVFTACKFVENKRRNSPIAANPSSFLVNIEYSNELRFNVEMFQRKNGTTVLPKAAPLIYWLSHEKDYQQIYELAYLQSLSDFSEKC